jgi:hypothetical protein
MVARRLALAFALLVVPATVSAPASAQTPVPSAPDVYAPLAESFFRQGLREFDAGAYDAACAALTESLRLDPKLGTLLNLALCHEKQGKTASAWIEYTHAAAWAAGIGQTERHDFASDHVTLLERRLFRVMLVLPIEPELKVEVDHQSLPEPEPVLPVFLDPGDHLITVSAPGRQRFETVFHVLPGANAQDLRIPALQAEVAVARPPPPAPPPPAIEGVDTRRLAGLVLGAAGLVTVGVSAYLGIRSVVTLGEVGAHCSGNVCDAAGLNLHNQARASETASLVCLGAGALALGTGVALTFTLRSKHPARKAAASPTLRLEALPGGAGLGFRSPW